MLYKVIGYHDGVSDNGKRHIDSTIACGLQSEDNAIKCMLAAIRAGWYYVKIETY